MPQPEPEIGTLVASPECPAGTPENGEIQENDRVGGRNPDFDGVIRSQILSSGTNSQLTRTGRDCLTRPQNGQLRGVAAPN